MYLWHVLLVRPFVALSILICLATILSCWLVLREQVHRDGLDRFLSGFVGLLSIYQALRLFANCGLLTFPGNSQFTDAVELCVTALYLVTTLIIRLSINNRMSMDSQLRLAKAAPPLVCFKEVPEEIIVEKKILESLAWALPQLSGDTFRLYAYLCLSTDPPTSCVGMGRHDPADRAAEDTPAGSGVPQPVTALPAVKQSNAIF
jgi:hypothetical protein